MAAADAKDAALAARVAISQRSQNFKRGDYWSRAVIPFDTEDYAIRIANDNCNRPWLGHHPRSLIWGR